MTVYTKYKKVYLSEDRERIGEFIRKYDGKSDKEILPAFFSYFLIPTIVRFEQVEHEYEMVKKELIKVINDPKRILEVYPGKDLIRLLNEWSNSKFHVYFTFDDLLKNIPVGEIDADFKTLVDKIVFNLGTEVYKYLEQSNEIPNEDLVNIYKRRITSQSPQLALAVEGNRMFLGGNINTNTSDNIMDSITAADYLLKSIQKVIPLNRDSKAIRTTVYDLKYESSCKILVSVAEINLRRQNENYDSATSSLLIIDPKSTHLIRHSIFIEETSNKEGNIDQVTVYMKNKFEGTIYFSMIYFNGGSNLYCMEYNFINNKILKQTEHRPGSDPGPRSLFIDSKNAKLYALVNHSLAPHVFVVCCRCNRLIDKIKLPANKLLDGVVKPDFTHHKNAIALDYNTNHLMVIENSELFDVDPLQRKVEKIKINKKFEYIVSNPNSKNTYFVSSDYDEDAENPYSNSLTVMRNDGSIKSAYKFSNEITVREIGINLDHGLLYVIGNHNDIEDEYGVWVFKEIQ
jgi:hypothetical protein